MADKEKIFPVALNLYSEYLKKNKMFFTKERSMLLHFIFDQTGHFSADELLFEVQRSNKKISRATLYRSLNQLVEVGILSESDFGHGHTHYEITLGERPHVHLICTDTGQVREVHSRKLEQTLTELATRENFKIKQYKIQIFGKSKNWKQEK